ncbi:hypothetical protein C8R43DRAFT_989292 [Mycena crocata]|nr:hypothetical protein C8R43DRAFT_989292 [Mycena crocata]
MQSSQHRNVAIMFVRLQPANKLYLLTQCARNSWTLLVVLNIVLACAAITWLSLHDSDDWLLISLLVLFTFFHVLGAAHNSWRSWRERWHNARTRARTQALLAATAPVMTYNATSTSAV